MSKKRNENFSVARLPRYSKLCILFKSDEIRVFRLKPAEAKIKVEIVAKVFSVASKITFNPTAGEHRPPAARMFTVAK